MVREFAISESCEGKFDEAGWFPGRHVSLTVEGLEAVGGLSMGCALLAKFGGLHVGACRPGRDCACSDIEFLQRVSVDEQYLLEDRKLAAELFPIAWAHRGHMILYIDSSGSIFASNTEQAGVALVGESFASAVETLLFGYRFSDWGMS